MGSAAALAIADYIANMSKNYVLEPFPKELVPIGGAPLEFVSDEDLMNAPAALLSHIVRTAANGGLQVMGPGAVPCTQLIRRVAAKDRQSDLIVCGSVASRDMSWPTYDGRTLSRMDAYEPYKSTTEEPALRGVLKTVSVSTGMDEPDNPVEAAVIKAVGVVALQRNVGGDAARAAEVYDEVWDLEPGTMADFERFTFGPQGDLLRYVLGQERPQPRVNMPLQASKTISVAMGSQVRSDYGPNRSIDWARMRVMAEARYYMCTRSEGVPLENLSSGPPPGDMTATLARPGILVFQPYPMSAFSYPDDTLALTIPTVDLQRSFRMPEAMRKKLTAIFDADNPKRKYLVKTAAPKYTVSRKVGLSTLGGSSISSASTSVVSAVLTKSVRGGSTVKVLRSQVYSIIDEALKQHVEGIEVAAEMLRVAEELFGKVDVRFDKKALVHLMSKACGVLGLRLRSNLAAELGRHRTTMDEAWEHHSQRLPAELRPSKESTIGWLHLIFHEILYSDDSKWTATVRAVSADRIRVLDTSGYDAFLPPGDKRGVEYFTGLMVNLLNHNRSLWFRYYDSTARVCYSIGRTVDPKAPKTRIVNAIRVGGLLWEFRARVVTTARITRIDHADWGLNPDALYSNLSYDGTDYSFEFKYDFPRQWAALLGSLKKIKFHEGRKEFPDANVPVGWSTRPGHVFGKQPLIYGVDNTRATRYVCNPALLWVELMDTLKMMREDVVSKSIAQFACRTPALSNAAVGAPVPIPVMAAPPVVEVANSYELLITNEADPHGKIEFLTEALGADRMDYLMGRSYENYAEFTAEVSLAFASVEAEEEDTAESRTNSVR